MEREELTDLILLYEKQSNFANIRLYETKEKKIFLTLNTFIQFMEGEDEINYHKALVGSPISLNSSATNYLVLGGADGLVSRDIFNYNKEASITLVDIDKEVIDLCMTNERIKKLNRDSLRLCNIIIDNALTWVLKCKEKFDIIICDFPDPNSTELEKLYVKEFYKDIYNILRDKGVISIQCNDKITDKVFNIINDIFGEIKIIEYKMPFLYGGKIILGRKINK